MKMFARLFCVALFLGAAPALADYDFGLEVGVRQQNGDPETAGLSGKSQMALQFGGFVHFPLQGALHLRTGMLYTQRPIIVETDATGAENKVSMNYLDVPVTLMYKFEEYAGIYGGFTLGLNIDSDADTGSVKGIKSPLVPFIFGAFFKFAPNLGAGLYYESASGDVADGLKNYRAVGANLMITFD